VTAVDAGAEVEAATGDVAEMTTFSEEDAGAAAAFVFLAFTFFSVEGSVAATVAVAAADCCLAFAEVSCLVSVF